MKNINEVYKIKSIKLKVCELFQLKSNLTRFHFSCCFLSIGGGRRGLVFGLAHVFHPLCISAAPSYFSKLIEELPFTVTGEK